MRKLMWIPPLLAAAFAHAGEVWKCGSSYGQARCAGGTRLEVAAPAADAAAPGAAARREQALADRLEKERLAREARAPQAVIPPQPQVAAPAHAKPPDKKTRKAGKDAQVPFTAVVPR